MISALKKLRGRLAISAAVVVAVGAIAFGTAAPALAAPVARVSVATSVSCSAKNGVTTIKITATGKTSGGATISNVAIDLDGTGNVANGNPSATWTTTTPGTYTGKITVTGNPNSPESYFYAKAGNGSCTAKTSSKPFVI
jgi:hypothetical protein